MSYTYTLILKHNRFTATYAQYSSVFYNAYNCGKKIYLIRINNVAKEILRIGFSMEGFSGFL